MSSKIKFFSNISNENRVIHEKVCFFFDYLSLFSEFANLSYKYQVKSHRSLLDNIIYQFKNNDDKKSISYLNDYLADDYLNNKDKIINKNVDLFKPIDSLRDYLKNKKFDLKEFDLKEFDLEPLLDLAELLNNEYIDDIIKILYNHIASEERLNSHNKECISYYASILASEFFLITCSKKDLESIIAKIIGNNYKVIGAPDEHISFEKSITDYKTYYSNRNLREQLNEIKLIYNYYKSSYKITYLAECNLKIKNKFELTIGDVHFTNNYKIEENEFWNILIKSELDLTRTVYVTLEIYYNTENSKIISHSKLLDTIKIFENNYGLKLMVLPYTIVNERHYTVKSKSAIEIEEGNAVLMFKCNKNEKSFSYSRDDLSQLIKKNDEYYFRGYYSDRIDEKLIYLWSYLESFEIRWDTEKCIKKIVKKVLSQIESNNKSRFYNFLINKYVNSLPSSIDLKQQSMLKDNWQKWESENFLKSFASEVNSPIIKDFLNNNIEYQRVYLNKLLSSIYEQRNMIVHGCRFNFSMVFTQIEMFTYIVKLYRIAMLKEASLI